MSRTDRQSRIRQCHQAAAKALSASGLRLHLAVCTMVWLTLWVGALYTAECVFAAVPWTQLARVAPSLFTWLDRAFYALDALVVIFLILPLSYGFARILFAAAEGKRLAIPALFDAFASAAAYRRALGRTLVWAAPRALVLGIFYALFTAAKQAAEPWMSAALWALLVLSVILLPIPLGLGMLLPDVCRATPSLTLRQAFACSRQRCKHRLLAIWRFQCSFIGWGLLSLLSFGVITVIHALPLYVFAYTHYTRSLIDATSSDIG